MSFLSDPLDPSDVARVIVATVRHPKVEVLVPQGRGVPSKVLGWSPAVQAVLYPLLERWGAARRERFMGGLGRNANAVSNYASDRAR
jgi:hypothetical protein